MNIPHAGDPPAAFNADVVVIERSNAASDCGGVTVNLYSDFMQTRQAPDEKSEAALKTEGNIARLKFALHRWPLFPAPVSIEALQLMCRVRIVLPAAKIGQRRVVMARRIFCNIDRSRHLSGRRLTRREHNSGY
jgi:hypothetical protein